MGNFYGVTLEKEKDIFVQETINKFFGTNYGTDDFVDFLYDLDRDARGYCGIPEDVKNFRKYLMMRWDNYIYDYYNEDGIKEEDIFNEDDLDKSSDRYELFTYIQKTIKQYDRTHKFTAVHLSKIKELKPHLFI